MLRLALPALYAALVLLAWLGEAKAGAFMMPEGAGQFIAGIGFVEASRRFDGAGELSPVSSFRKTYASGYLEYGLASTTTLVVAPSVDRERDSPIANSASGTDGSAIGLRQQIYGAPGEVVAVQALFQPPIGGVHNLGADVRLLFGRAFSFFGCDSFIDLEPGVRIRADPYPNEARLDATFGIRPTSRILAMIQLFASDAPASQAVTSQAYAKLQGSVVYDLATRWSVQLGAVRTVAGRNIVRETGPIFGVWYRF